MYHYLVTISLILRSTSAADSCSLFHCTYSLEEMQTQRLPHILHLSQTTQQLFIISFLTVNTKLETDDKYNDLELIFYSFIPYDSNGFHVTSCSLNKTILQYMIQ